MLNLITKHLADLTAGNWDEYRAALAENVVYEEIATGRRASGVDDYMRTVERWKQAFPDLKATIIRASATDHAAAAEVEWEGTHRGAFHGALGPVPATNRKARARAAIVYEVENGKIKAARHYFDLLSLMLQLGIEPALGARDQPRPSRETAAPPARTPAA